MSVQAGMHVHESDTDTTELECDYKSEFDSPTGREYFVLTISSKGGDHVRAYLPVEVLEKLEEEIGRSLDERSAVVDGPADLKGSIPAEQDPVYRQDMVDAGRGRQLP